jgi:hypothetical protein
MIGGFGCGHADDDYRCFAAQSRFPGFSFPPFFLGPKALPGPCLREVGIPTRGMGMREVKGDRLVGGGI